MNKRDVIKDIDDTIALYQEAIDSKSIKYLLDGLYCRFCIRYVGNCMLCSNGVLKANWFSSCLQLNSCVNVGIKGSKTEARRSIAHRMTVLENWKTKIFATKGRITLDQYRQLQESVDCKIKKKENNA